jgi:hypothetical protein
MVVVGLAQYSTQPWMMAPVAAVIQAQLFFNITDRRNKKWN